MPGSTKDDFQILRCFVTLFEYLSTGQFNYPVLFFSLNFLINYFGFDTSENLQACWMKRGGGGVVLSRCSKIDNSSRKFTMIFKKKVQYKYVSLIYF